MKDCYLTSSVAVTLGLETVQQQVHKNLHCKRQYVLQCQKAAGEQKKAAITKYLDTIEIPNPRGGR